MITNLKAVKMMKHDIIWTIILGAVLGVTLAVLAG